MTTPLRRSGRHRATIARYSEDASKTLGGIDHSQPVSEAEDASEASSAEVSERSAAGAVSSDESFHEEVEEASKSEESLIESDASDIDMTEAPSPLRPRQESSRKKPHPQPKANLRARGLTLNQLRMRQFGDLISSLTGPVTQEKQHYAKMIEHWHGVGIFPSRESLASAAGKKDRDLTVEFTQEQLERWAWYHEQKSRDTITSRQETHSLAMQDATQYLPPRLPSHKVVLGPHTGQTLYNLGLNRPLYLSEAWKIQQTADSAADDPSKADDSTQYEPNGWLLYLGAKIQSLAWAPNQTAGSQYLAVAIHHEEPSDESQYTAFEPSHAFKSCIQIWRFQAHESTGFAQTLDTTQPPTLAHVICAEWGMCRQIKWCSIPDPNSNRDTEQNLHLGLMATVWSDGFVRVLDISLPSQTGGDIYFKYQGAVLASKPAKALCTTVAWISPAEIVAGCSDGKVVIWNLSEHLQNQIQASQRKGTQDGKPSTPAQATVREHIDETPAPLFLYQLHDSYIIAASTCLPQYPHLLVTAAADGYYRLCDLRNPEYDVVDSHRYRHFPSAFDYCPHLGAIVASDGQGSASFLHLRRFFAGSTAATCDAQIMTISCAGTHPTMLLGSANGTVLAANAIPGILKDNRAINKWEVIWFKHEWRPETGLGSANPDATDVDSPNGPASNMNDVPSERPGRRLRPGISRISEAFAPRLKLKKTKDNNSAPAQMPSLNRWETIYEEPSAITQLDWCPTLHCGGWAAVGMGSGLLRVENLTV